VCAVCGVWCLVCEGGVCTVCVMRCVVSSMWMSVCVYASVCVTSH
jgi:hypothetical protein